jgi:hypothetical protein
MKFLKRREDTFDYDLERTCASCGSIFHGRYCYRCGEKVIEPHERSVIAFLDGLLNAFTFLEGRFIRSIKLLLTHPGQLSRNISQGNQVPYMRMLNLFFVANFFYFFFFVFDSYNSSLDTQMKYFGSHSEQVRKLVDTRVSTEGLDLTAFKKSYEANTINLSKLLLITLVIMLTGLFALLNFSRKKQFADYLLVSLEYYTFQLLFVLVILANTIFHLICWVYKAIGYNWSILLSDDVFSLFGMALTIWFLYKVERNFFQQKWYWALGKAITLHFLIGQTIYLYRISLFYVTFYTM